VNYGKEGEFAIVRKTMNYREREKCELGKGRKSVR
jgi:hypothetical protein